MENESLNPIKRDADANLGIEIATYDIIDSDTGLVCNHVIKKNGKGIGWALSREGALQIHDMYARIQILKEDDTEYMKRLDEEIRKMRSRVTNGIRNNNSYLHDLPDRKI